MIENPETKQCGEMTGYCWSFREREWRMLREYMYTVLMSKMPLACQSLAKVSGEE